MDSLTSLRSTVDMNRPLDTLTLVATAGCGAMAGVFIAFSTFVMPALRKLPPPQGAAAMQSINRQAITPLFMVLLFGTAAVCLILLVAALSGRIDEPRPVIAGAALYLGGAILVTAVRNVPLNDALAAVDLASSDAIGAWQRFLDGWLPANHLRALASSAAAVAFLLAR